MTVIGVVGTLVLSAPQYPVSQGKAMFRASSPISRLSWRKSTYSIANGECVEAAAVGGHVIVRDSGRKFDAPLQFPATNWYTFITAIKKRKR